MARKTREGFVLYKDIILNQMQYLTDAEFKTVIIAAMEASVALANREPEPPLPALEGLAAGSYQALLRTIRESQRQYDKVALKNKINRQKIKPAILIAMSDEQLLSLGYTIYDIAALRECDPSEVGTSACDSVETPDFSFENAVQGLALSLAMIMKT